MSIINRSSNKKSEKNAEKFAEDLEKVLDAFVKTEVENYVNMNKDTYRREFIKSKVDTYDHSTITNNNIIHFRIIVPFISALGSLKTACDKFTKSFSEGGIFSISNYYLMKISFNAKRFINDLSKILYTEHNTKEIAENNLKKIVKNIDSLVKSLRKVVNTKVKAPNCAAKVQDKKVKDLMNEISNYINMLYVVYLNYVNYCF